jgi:predicted RNA binding protein YcfA (HicA-like mRNA interferase family)
MDRREMRRRMAQHPNAVTFDEARRVLEAFGWELRRVTGSHHVFSRGGERLTVPHRRPCILAVYVRQILRATEGRGDDDVQDDA